MKKELLERYSRQIIIKDIGALGQKKISSSKILIIGAGGLGCPVADLLSRAGVGEIGIVDNDKVCLLYTSPSPRDRTRSRMPSSA